FTPVLVYIFGGVMILASLMLVYLMSRAVRSHGLPVWLYVGPVLVLGAGVVMVCMGQPRLTDSVVTLITGIGMIVYALSWFTAAIMMNRAAGEQARIAMHDDRGATVPGAGGMDGDMAG
ncbi:MAG: hypothetical protein K2L41_08280, partial [Muribaculaceae bacterium]|nr:hypothetical protein [Muribaculaceae bacterium]